MLIVIPPIDEFKKSGLDRSRRSQRSDEFGGEQGRQRTRGRCATDYSWEQQSHQDFWFRRRGSSYALRKQARQVHAHTHARVYEEAAFNLSMRTNEEGIT